MVIAATQWGCVPRKMMADSLSIDDSPERAAKIFDDDFVPLTHEHEMVPREAKRLLILEQEVGFSC